MNLVSSEPSDADRAHLFVVDEISPDDDQGPETAGGGRQGVDGSSSAGLDEGFVALYEEHYPRLVRALELSGANRETAEDVAQEAFSRTLTHWPRGPARHEPRGLRLSGRLPPSPPTPRPRPRIPDHRGSHDAGHRDRGDRVARPRTNSPCDAASTAAMCRAVSRRGRFNERRRAVAWDRTINGAKADRASTRRPPTRPWRSVVIYGDASSGRTHDEPPVGTDRRHRRGVATAASARTR